MLHELWVGENTQTFCLSGAHGEDARRELEPGSRLVWTVEAASHFEAMTLYYIHMDWGVYTTDSPEIDRRTYAELG